MKQDRRVIKTKKAIRNAFAKLLSEKDVDKITVKDIADVADINRKTFYNYYSGVYQVIDEIENEVIHALDQVLDGITLDRDLNNLYPLFVNLTAIINKDLDFYGYLMRADNKSLLIPKIIAIFREKLQISLCKESSVDPETLNLMIEYIFSGMLSVYRHWFNSDRKQSIEEISKLVSRLATANLNLL